jgi:hypothetical protein
MEPPTSAWAPKVPFIATLFTQRLRAIAAANGIGAGQTGIQLSRTIGLAFENWVLTALWGPQYQRWTTPILSPRRKQKTGGLPASVIPENVTPLALVDMDEMTAVPFPDSQFWEVKAVTGNLTLSTSRYQILGLIDVATLSPAGMSTMQPHPPPAVVFVTTGNTIVGPDVLLTATQLGVAIWQGFVWEDGTTPNDPNPDLYLGPITCLNPTVYGGAVPWPMGPYGVHSKLTSPPNPPQPVPGDPDPPEVD